MPGISKVPAAASSPVSASGKRIGHRRGRNPQAIVASIDMNEKLLTISAAVTGSRPRCTRCEAWCRLTPACTG